MNKESTVMAYALVIVIAASLAANQYVPLTGSNAELTGYAAKEAATQAIQETEGHIIAESEKVPFSTESLGYVLLIVLLLAGAYLVVIIERFKNRLIKRK